MSKRPAYLKTKSSSYWVICALLAAIAWVVYGIGNEFELQYLVENSVLKNRNFQGKTEEIFVPSLKTKAYFMEENTNPLVAVSFLFDEAGTAYDEKGKEGLVALTAATIKDGAGEYSAKDLKEQMAINGIKIAFSANKDWFAGTLVTPKENLPQAVDILKNILLRPNFENDYFKLAKAQTIKALKTEKENPQKELQLEFNKKIYQDHPYANNPLGSEETVTALKRQDLKDFVKNNLAKENLYLGIAGDLTKEEAAHLIADIFSELPDKKQAKKLPPLHINWQQDPLQINRKSGQTVVNFAGMGTCRKCEDFYPLYIANYIFGGSGLNSKINMSLREKEGLTYGAYSGLVINDKSNLLAAGFSTTPDNYSKALDMFYEEWQKIAKDGFSEEELEAAKNYLTSSYNLRFASIEGIADMLVMMQKYDLGLDFLQKRNGYVDAVTIQQVNDAAAKYFTKEILRAEIGNFEEGK